MRNLQKHKRSAAIFFSVFSIIFSAFQLGCKSDKKIQVIKLGHGLDPSHPVHLALEFLAGRVAEKSKGRLRIDVYPSEQLGSERECLELLQIGSLAMTKVSCSVIEGFVPEMGVVSLPYLFRDEEHRFKVLEGEIGRELLRAGEKYWLYGLCYYDAGTRSFYTKARPILRPEDLAGLKIRTQESPTSIKMVQALGGSATPIAWGELYSALQQGVVDGAENNPPSFYLSRHYEVCKFYSLDEHTGVPDVLVISTKVWDSLPPEFQIILQEAADESALYQKKLWKEATQEALEQVQRAGVEIYYPEKEPFIQRTESIYEDYRNEPEIYRLIQRIRAVR
jgi:tripartite ATP-independent transporter DctP family solute receptor